MPTSPEHDAARDLIDAAIGGDVDALGEMFDQVFGPPAADDEPDHINQ